MNDQYQDGLEYFKSYQIAIDENDDNINFIRTNDIHRIQRYFPYSKNDWKDINFAKIIGMVEFDNELRKILFGIIGTVEINFKSILCNEISRFSSDPCVYKNDDTFYESAEEKEKTIAVFQQIEKNCISGDIFLKKEDIDSGQVPVYAFVQKMTFGETISFYHGLCKELRQSVYEAYPVCPNFEANLIVAKNFRNICCHMDILNKKKYLFKPSFSLNEKEKIDFCKINQEKLFTQVYCMKLLCLDHTAWKTHVAKVQLLIIDAVKKDIIKLQKQYGFPQNWYELLNADSDNITLSFVNNTD